LIYKTKFLPPYDENGKTNFPSRKRTGVYLIKENGIIVYVGYSGKDLYKTMYRHFEQWTGKQEYRTSICARFNGANTVLVAGTVN
jgi:hypothetical protein